MFEEVPEQFHQFIASSTRTTTTLPLPLSFPSLQHHHGSSNANYNTFPSFDPLFPSSHQQVPPLQQAHFLHHPLHQQTPVPPPTHKINGDKQDNSLMGMNLEIDQRERSSSSIPDQHQLDHHHPWSNDEVLALLRIRSSMENWFPEFTWEHVSRKLSELGFKRSAEKCKEKFEEESRYFNNSINYSNKSSNYRIFSELEELCHGDHHHQKPHPHVLVVTSADDQKKKTVEKPSDHEEEEDKMVGQDFEDHDDQQTIGNIKINPGDDQGNNEKVVNETSISKKRKRSSSEKKHFEIFKGFCEDVVYKMMVQQEEMQNKLLQDMVKRDEENDARDEAWKKQEIDRINKELEIRGQEQAIVGDRQSTIINFLKKFTSSSSSFEERNDHQDLVSYSPQSSSSLVLSQNPSPSTSCHANNQLKNVELPKSLSAICNQNSTSFPLTQIPTSLTENLAPQNPNSTTFSPPKVPTSSSTLAPTPQNPNSLDLQKNPLTPTSVSIHKADPSHEKCYSTSINDHKEDLGKRWPRDEVLALINMRCNLYNINGDHHQDHKEGSTSAAAAKATPLWERISQGMLELGYKRSAKRCKEKWENINKYFRKTKDVNKKRSLDSRTCPYFHQLSTLYYQGTLVPPNGGSENYSALPENHSDLPETTRHGSSQGGSRDYVADHQGEKSMVQVPAFGFEF